MYLNVNEEYIKRISELILFNYDNWSSASFSILQRISATVLVGSWILQLVSTLQYENDWKCVHRLIETCWSKHVSPPRIDWNGAFSMETPNALCILSLSQGLEFLEFLESLAAQSMSGFFACQPTASHVLSAQKIPMGFWSQLEAEFMQGCWTGFRLQSCAGFSSSDPLQSWHNLVGTAQSTEFDTQDPATLNGEVRFPVWFPFWCQ